MYSEIGDGCLRNIDEHDPNKWFGIADNAYVNPLNDDKYGCPNGYTIPNW